MPITYFCAKCGSAHVVPDEALGKKIRCKQCKAISRIQDNFIDRPEAASAAIPVDAKFPRSKKQGLNAVYVLIGATILMPLIFWGGQMLFQSPPRTENTEPVMADDANVSEARPGASQPPLEEETASRDDAKTLDTLTKAEQGVRANQLPHTLASSEPVVPTAQFSNSIDMQLVLIPGGRFKMGSPNSEPERNHFEHLHSVETSPYYVGITEVTQEQFEAVMGANPSAFSATGVDSPKVTGIDTSEFPVEWVSHADAMEFCLRLSSVPEELAAGRVYRLPTEAEWEKACRGGVEGQVFSFGDTLTSAQANVDGTRAYAGGAIGDYSRRTMKVGQFEPNEFGLFDMHGNVAEWCLDRFDESFYEYSPGVNPQGPVIDTAAHVVRGGSWYFHPTDARSAKRSVRPHLNADSRRHFRCNYIGFRVVCLTHGSALHQVVASTEAPVHSKKTSGGSALSISQLLQKAANHASRSEFEAASKLAKQALEQDPLHQLALTRYAQFEYRHACEMDERKQISEAESRYLSSAETMRKLLSTGPTLNDSERSLAASIFCDEASVQSRSGDSKKGLAALQEAIAAGFDDFYYIRNEPDLQRVRDLPEFAELLSQWTLQISERAVSAARAALDQHRSYPFEFSLQTIDGKRITLSEMKGKVVIVDIWGTWCPPCRAMVPSLVRLKSEFESRGFEIVGINFERVVDEEAVQTIQEFCREQSVNYPCAVGNDGVGNQVPGFGHYPLILFIDRKGAVRLTRTGSQSFESMKAVVDLLLAESESG